MPDCAAVIRSRYMSSFFLWRVGVLVSACVLGGCTTSRSGGSGAAGTSTDTTSTHAAGSTSDVTVSAVTTSSATGEGPWGPSDPGICNTPGIVTLATAPSPSNRVSTQLKVDADRIYWVDQGPATSSASIRSVPKCGGAVTELASDQGWMPNFAIDDAYAYWSGYDAFHTASGLVRVPLIGGPVDVINPNSAGYALVVDTTNIYWLTGNSPNPITVLSMPKAGGPMTTLATSKYEVTTLDNGIVADADNVYWEDGNMTLESVPKAGGNISPLTALTAVRLLALHGASLFWSSDNGGGGSLMTIPTSGGTPTALQKAIVSSIAADDTDVYWSAYIWQNPGASYVAKIPIAGGTPQMIATGLDNLGGIAVDTTHVYWIQSRNLVAMPK